MLILGKESLLEKGSTIIVNKQCELTIGARFKLGANARLYVADHWVFGDNVKIEHTVQFLPENLKRRDDLKLEVIVI